MKTDDGKLVTETKLEQALERLLQGKPERTKSDGKISIKRINDEGGLSSGGIYYYKEFLTKARAVIAERKSSADNSSYSIDQGDLVKLRAERDKQRELKTRYREQRDKITEFSNGVIEENAKLHFSLYEAIIKIEQLEKEIVDIKVTKFPGGKK